GELNMVVLDTDHMTLLAIGQGAEYERLRGRLEALAPEERVTTIVTYEEQMRGWLDYAAKARTPEKMVAAYRRLSNLLTLFRPFRVLEFDEPASAEFRRLQQERLRIGTKDLLIASIALAQGAMLLTRNRRHFGK